MVSGTCPGDTGTYSPGKSPSEGKATLSLLADGQLERQ